MNSNFLHHNHIKMIPSRSVKLAPEKPRTSVGRSCNLPAICFNTLDNSIHFFPTRHIKRNQDFIATRYYLKWYALSKAICLHQNQVATLRQSRRLNISKHRNCKTDCFIKPTSYSRFATANTQWKSKVT